jgi:hypothetical protein
VFHSPQPVHLPTQRAETVPQFWQTNDVLAAFAIVLPAALQQAGKRSKAAG